MDFQKYKELNWFVEFAGADLLNMSLGDKAKFLVESPDFLPSIKGAQELAREFIPDSGRMPSAASAAAETFILNRFVKPMAPWAFNLPSSETAEFWALMIEFQKITRRTFEEILEMAQKQTRDIFAGRNTSYCFRLEDRRFRLKTFPFMKGAEEYLEFKLRNLFVDLPDTTLCKCQGCDQYFINPSMRRKTFCSTRCMYRVNAQKRREGDREAYNARQREIMRKRYAAEKKKKYGPHVRINRRRGGE